MSLLSPDEIRMIREGLGLTQREAGELLGGGPNAFAKYESGRTAPSTAFANLLMLLKANPGALNTLHPERAAHTPAALPLPFEVTSRHLAAISKQTFPTFIRLLVGAEASSHGVPTDGIHAANKVEAPDGGEDGRIHWNGGPARTSFLPDRLCQFQLKTGKLTPAMVGREVLTKAGEVKPMIQTVLNQGGHYIVLSTNAYTQQQIEAREFRIREALQGAGQEIDDVQICFRDASQLADWINTHPAVALWLLERAEPGLLGPFRAWSHWDGRTEHFGSPWVDDERLDNLRRFLREQIAIGQPRKVARVVGLAGIGKSRLTLEAFRPFDSGDREPTDLRSLVLYAIEGEVSPETLKSTVQKLADSGKRAIVVVDQCAPETHRTLVLMVSRNTSQLSLLTLDDELPSGTLDPSTYKVGKASSDVTEAIVAHVAPGLQSLDQQRLVHFSLGFPGVAHSIARAWIDATPLAHATDNDLVDAYVLGRDTLEPELLLKSAALLATFRLIGTETRTEDQLTGIAKLGRHLNPEDLYEGLNKLVERGIARRQGRYVSIQSGPIAMRLAERQWKEWQKHTWDMVLTDISSYTSFDGDLRLNVLAAKQLKLLDSLDVSKAVVNHVCRYGGPFFKQQGGLSRQLALQHAEVLSHLAEIDTEIIAKLLERSLVEVEDVPLIVGETRKHLVRALGKIAFKANTFEDGACLLIHLATAEKGARDNHATKQFVSLFPPILGDTEADGTQRLNLLDSLSKTDDPIRKEIVTRALTNGLKMKHFSRHIGPEVHGTRPAMEPWLPETKEEVRAYVHGCATRLIEFAAQNDSTGALARNALGPELDSLINHGFIDVAELAIERAGTETEHWPEALNTLGLYLSRCDTDEPSELADRVRAMIDRLKPTSLEARVQFLVTNMPWEYLYTKNGSYKEQQQRQVEAVRKLATEAIRQPETLQTLLLPLSRGRQQMAREFGQAIGEITDSQDNRRELLIQDDWLELIIQALEKVPEAERNYDLLKGYIQNIAEDQPAMVEHLKQRATKEPLLIPVLQMLCALLRFSASDTDLIIKVLQDGSLPPSMLTGAGIWDSEPEVVTPLFDTLLEHSNEGLASAIKLMEVYVYGNRDRLNAVCPQIQKMAAFVSHWPWEINMMSGDLVRHGFRSILTPMLEQGPGDRNASAVALALSKAVSQIKGYEGYRVMEPLLPILLSRFPAIAWPLIGTAIVTAEPHQSHRFELLLREPGRKRHGESTAPILSLPEDTLFAWCHAHPERAPAFAARTVSFLGSQDHGGNGLYVHPVMIRLIEEFGNRKDVTEASYEAMGNKGFVELEESLWMPYQKPLMKLLDHPNPTVQRWAKNGLRWLRKVLEDSRLRDAEREARVEG